MAQNGLFPVSQTRHKYKFWHPFASYHFARFWTECTIVAEELHLIAAAFPVVFTCRSTSIEPVALLSISPGAPTPYVSPEGRWRAAYVPSALRCFPFSAGGKSDVSSATGKRQLFVDEFSGLVTDTPSGRPFFDDLGQLSPELAKVAEFLQMREAAGAQTRWLTSLVSEMDLLVPIDAHVVGSPSSAHMRIDDSRLKQLPQAQLTMLATSGALELIHAHKVSLAHCDWLRQFSDHSGNTETESKIPCSDFLTALAQDVAEAGIQGEVSHATA